MTKTMETMGNADLGGTKQNIYRSKDVDESYIRNEIKKPRTR